MAEQQVQKQIDEFQRKFSTYGDAALHLAYHAALPVALNPELLHLLRINFFLDPPEPLPYSVEFDFLLSPLCRQIDESLYEIEPEIRTTLLEGLTEFYDSQRLEEIATLLWQYIETSAVWENRVGLERAQQLTALNFLDSSLARQWLDDAEAQEGAGLSAEREWFLVMRQETEKIESTRSEISKRGQSVQTRNFLFQAPPLPENYVPRLQVLKSLKREILDRTVSQRKVKTSGNGPSLLEMTGVAGIGKTVMASALAHDAEIQALFPDGVLWANLEQSSDILSLLAHWIQDLDDADYSPTSVNAAWAHLNELLHNRNILLILDDVSNDKKIDPLLIGGEGCLVMITTRKGLLSKTSSFKLDSMSLEESVSLLENTLERKLIDEDRRSAVALAEKLKYIPLALCLAGNHIQQGQSLQSALQAIDNTNGTGFPDQQNRQERREYTKLLILATNSNRMTRLRLDEEVRDISTVLERAKYRDEFDIAQRWAARPRDLHRAMLDEEPQIVHFSGHAEGAAGLYFEDNVGNAQLITGDALAGLFKMFKAQVTCVVLNGCYAKAQAEAISAHIPYVIGLPNSVNDRAAIEFSVGFYDALGSGKSVEFAFELGKAAVALSGSEDEDLLVLLRSDATSNVTSASASQPSAKFVKSETKLDLNQPLNVFISYSHRDEELKEELEIHLATLKRQKKIKPWQDRSIEVGEEWDYEIKTALEDAQIILLLITPRFMASGYINKIELAHAMERHKAGTARVIPIILKPVDMQGTFLSNLQALPKDAKPVTQWDDLDEAFINVVNGIRRVVDSLTKDSLTTSSTSE